MRTCTTFLLFLLLLPASMAQQAAPAWLENSLYGNGKINVVVAVVAVIILGIGLWLWRMDVRLRHLENKHTRS